MGRYGNVVTGPKKTPANTVKNSMFSRAPQTPPRIASRPKPWPVRSSIPISGQPLGAGEQKAIAQSQTARSPEAFRRTPPATVSRFSPEAARRTPPATVSAPPPRPVQRPGQPTATSAPPPTSPEAFRRTPPATVGGFSPEAARRTPPATVSRFSPEAARRTPPATTASRYPSPEALKRPPPATVGTPTTRSPEAARAGTISSRLTNPADIAMLNFARRAGSGTTGMPTADRAMIDFARRAGSGTTGTPTTRSPEAARAGTTGAATNPNYDMGGPFPNATNPDFDMGGPFPNATNPDFDMGGPFPNAPGPGTGPPSPYGPNPQMLGPDTSDPGPPSMWGPNPQMPDPADADAWGQMLEGIQGEFGNVDSIYNPQHGPPSGDGWGWDDESSGYDPWNPPGGGVPDMGGYGPWNPPGGGMPDMGGFGPEYDYGMQGSGPSAGMGTSNPNTGEYLQFAAGLAENEAQRGMLTEGDAFWDIQHDRKWDDIHRQIPGLYNSLGMIDSGLFPRAQALARGDQNTEQAIQDWQLENAVSALDRSDMALNQQLTGGLTGNLFNDFSGGTMAPAAPSEYGWREYLDAYQNGTLGAA